MTATAAKLERTTLRTSRLQDFCSLKELIIQTGHDPDAWPLVVLKELVDNALDACEEAGVPPEINVIVDDVGITVTDNGSGIPSDTITDVMDFSVRISSREAYVAPDRGAQGNALMTILAIPFVLDGKSGRVVIRAQGIKHEITFRVDPILQGPVFDHTCEDDVTIGTSITVKWPDSALLNPRRRERRICTNCRRLHMAEPAPGAQGRLARRACRGRSNRPCLVEVEAVRSDVGALVHAPAS